MLLLPPPPPPPSFPAATSCAAAAPSPRRRALRGAFRRRRCHVQVRGFELGPTLGSIAVFFDGAHVLAPSVARSACAPLEAATREADPPDACEGGRTRRVQLVRGEGRDVSN